MKQLDKNTDLTKHSKLNKTILNFDQMKVLFENR
jgi:hypothetical protein